MGDPLRNDSGQPEETHDDQDRNTGNELIPEVLEQAIRRVTNGPRADSSWDGQWLNWDDLGPQDPTPGGWGDVGD